jgi:hypothetical protein
MKRIAFSLILALAIPVIALAQEGAGQSSVEQEILKISDAHISALIRGDLDTFESYHAEDYTEIRAHGRLYNRGPLALMMKASKAAGSKVERYDLKNRKVRVYGDTAVLTGEYSRKGYGIRRDGQKVEYDDQGLFTDVYVKKQGRWLLVHNQDTAIPKQGQPQPAGQSSAQANKPNLTGTWERAAIGGSGNPGTETMTLVHHEPHLYLLYRINDRGGERTLDLKGMIDGKPHEQQIEGRPATLTAQWQGQDLVLEIKRESSLGYTHVRRKMTFSNDGKVMTTERTYYSKDGALQGTGTERWEKK